MSTSLNNDELYDLLTDAEDIFSFFKVIKDNNLIVNRNGSIHKDHNGCILDVESEFDISQVIYEFYNYWLKHNSLSINNSGFINLRC